MAAAPNGSIWQRSLKSFPTFAHQELQGVPRVSCATSLPSPVILPVLESWETFLCCFFSVYAHQERSAKRKQLFKGMRVWTNVSFLSKTTTTTITWFFRALWTPVLYDICFPEIQTCFNILTRAQGWWNHYYFMASTMVCFPAWFSSTLLHI